jgi:hypothetical protein
LSSLSGKPVVAAFDGGRLSSASGVLLLGEIDRRLGISERLAGCLRDDRAPERIQHSYAEMIRFRALLIACGYPDGNDCDALRADPAFKMAVGRLPDSGGDLCSQPTVSRLENTPGRIALLRMMAAMIDLFCDSFAQVPRRVVLGPLGNAEGGTSTIPRTRSTARSNCPCSMPSTTATACCRSTSTTA